MAFGGSPGLWWGCRPLPQHPPQPFTSCFWPHKDRGVCHYTTKSVTSEGAICVGTPLAPADVPA